MNRFFAASRRDTISPGNSRTLNVRPAGDAERPRFLTGAKPRTGQWRDELALFVVSCKPFARTYANRVWYHLMGRGIVHPIDDFHRQNPPSVPALLEALTAEVTRTGFQLKPLLRSICNSRAYQCSSVSRQASAEKKKAQRAVFALRQIKPLTAEQTYDSVMIAIEQKPNAAQRLQFVRRSVGQALDEDFSHTWQYRETVQSLMARLNMTLPAKIATTEKLYRRILSRDPSAAEVKACRGHSRQDITFALVNSNEFFFNH